VVFGRSGFYTNEAMTENLAYYARHGYAETHRAEHNGFHRARLTAALIARVAAVRSTS
jgi:hypothetical protein